MRGAVRFGFGSHWLEKCREVFKITRRISRNRVVTFDSHLKTALILTTQLTILITVCLQGNTPDRNQRRSVCILRETEYTR